jgi:hypothetical protein
MIEVLKILVRWCDVMTALITLSDDLNAHDRATIRLRLRELKDAVQSLDASEEENAQPQEDPPGPAAAADG